MGLFSTPAPAPVVQEQPPVSKRHLLILIPIFIGILGGGLLTGNPLAGAILGLAVGMVFHGVPRQEAIRGDEFAKRKVYRRPYWYRLTASALAFGGAILWLAGVTGVDLAFLQAYVPLTGSEGKIAGIVTIVASVLFALFGKFKAIQKAAKSGVAKRKAVTEDEQALLAFSENTLRQAGLGVTSDVAREEILPRILEKGIDDKGRAIVRIAVIPGKQTVQDIFKAEERIATAWQIPRVVITQSKPLKDGGHTVEIMAVLQDSLVPDLVEWEPVDTNVSVIDYVSQLPMGLLTESADPWILDLNSRNFVIGGEPGSGKSSFMNALVGHLIRHPDTRVQYIDLKKGADALSWKDSIAGAVHNGAGGSGVQGALDFFREATEDMTRRYNRMVAAEVENAWTEGFLGPEEPVKVLILDETSELFKTGTKASRETTDALIEEIKTFIQQGRAAGYILIMATQFPITENLPSPIRTVASDKLAFRMTANGVAATLGGDFIWKKHNDPTKSGIGEAVIRARGMEGERVKFAFVSKEKKRELILESKTTGKPWLDGFEEEEVELEEIELEEEELPDDDDEDYEMPVYPRPVQQRPRPVWK